jgi:hypothetical protein
VVLKDYKVGAKWSEFVRVYGFSNSVHTPLN